MSSGFRTAVMAAMLATAAPAVQAQMAVFDAATYAGVLAQITTATNQLAQLQQQLQTQLQMVTSLGSDFTGPIMQAVSQTQGVIGTIANVQQQGAILNNTLNSIFTSDFTGRSPGDIVATMNQVNALLRTNQLAANAVQNQVVANQRIAQQQIASGLAASNAAVGQTAAVQATNQLLAAIAAKLDDQQALLITISKSLSDQAMAKSTASQAGAAATGNDTENYTPSFNYSGVPTY